MEPHVPPATSAGSVGARSDVWTAWVVMVGIGAAATGALFACAAHTASLAPVHDAAWPVFWGPDEPSEAARRYAYWSHGVLGGVMAGWGAMIVGVALGPFRRRERWAWWCLLSAFGSWFVLDTGASIAYGVTFNVWLNAGALVLGLIPMIATARASLGARPSLRGDAPPGG